MTHHYLLTRFNLALWQEDKNGQTIDRGEWLRKRLKLFETYCLLRREFSLDIDIDTKHRLAFGFRL